jgi:hypothetical protein
MTQSKDNDTLTITLDDYVSGEDITINLDDTYGTTTYWGSGSITDVVYSDSADSTFTIDTSTMDTINIDWLYNNTNIDPSEVERMCNEYPALEKVWRNFKSVYDMVKQDYEGKKKAGEIDDDIPF